MSAVVTDTRAPERVPRIFTMASTKVNGRQEKHSRCASIQYGPRDGQRVGEEIRNGCARTTAFAHQRQGASDAADDWTEGNGA